MDRKGILILVITVGAMLTWHFGYYAPRMQEWQAQQIKKQEDQRAKKKAEDEAKALAAAANPVEADKPAASSNPGNAETPATPVAEPKPVVTAETKELAGVPGTVNYKFTNLGGGIARAVLKEHRGEGEKRMTLNEFGNIPIGAMVEKAGDAAELSEAWAMSVDEATRTVTMARTDEAKKIRITKKFTLPRSNELKDEYQIGLQIAFENIGQQPVAMPGYFLHAGSTGPIYQRDERRYIGLDWWRDGTNTFESIDWFAASGGFIGIGKRDARPVFTHNESNVSWVSAVNQYFTTMIAVKVDESLSAEDKAKLRGTGVWAAHAEITKDQWLAAGHTLEGKNPLDRLDTALAMPGFPIAPGSTVNKDFQIYAGPREYRRLRLLDNNEGDVMDYGSFLGLPISLFSKTLLNAMNLFYSWIGNYAVAIILLTVVVKAILWPLQNRATRQMKRMALLQPRLKELQDKYKSDPMKYQQEMGRIFKTYGVNPLSGCWPMLIQVPIFFGFYSMLGKAVELRDHGFLWVHDLAAPDTIFHIAGIPVNPLPLCMAATMLLQMKLSPQTGDPAQRKMFMFMPLIFIFICYNFASALALYWTVQNVISIVQLFVTKNQDEPTLEKRELPPVKKR